MSIELILVIVVSLVIVWLYGIHASLIQKRNKMQEAFSVLDVQLKKRYDLIPDILRIAQKYMDHELSLIEEVLKLRIQIMEVSSSYENIDRKVVLDYQIVQKMGQIIAAAENYPQIKSEQAMNVALQTYNDVEDFILAESRFYNAAANELKNAVERFPSSFFARMLNIKAVDFFKAEEKARQTIKTADIQK